MEARTVEIPDEDLDSAIIGIEQSLRTFLDVMRNQPELKDDVNLLEVALNYSDIKSLKIWVSRTTNNYVYAVQEYIDLQEKKFARDGDYYYPVMKK